VFYTGLRSDSIKNHASRNEARHLTCICLTAIWRHVLLAPSYLRLLGGECVSVDVESCCCISNLRFNLYCLAYSAFFCFCSIFVSDNVEAWCCSNNLHFNLYWHVYVLPPGYFVWPCSPHIHRTEFLTSHNEQKTKAIKCGACASCYKYGRYQHWYR
jgi:hypothetical protein